MTKRLRQSNKGNDQGDCGVWLMSVWGWWMDPSLQIPACFHGNAPRMAVEGGQSPMTGPSWCPGFPLPHSSLILAMSPAFLAFDTGLPK